jgi:casein kinase II subunit beta
MSITSSQGPDSWIASFCSLVGHEYFAEVSEDFIEDDFNLTGLQSQVPMYKDALEMILDVEPSETSSSVVVSEEEEEEEEEEEDDGILGEELDEPPLDGARRVGQQPGARSTNAVDPATSTAAARRHIRTSSDASVIEASAELLYGLIHARYITSRPGIQQMLEKYELSHFGHCPRVYCAGARVLPVGRTDTPGQETVKLFCPSCLDVYTPPNSRFQAVDGAFFGTTFGCLFFMTFPELDISPQTKNGRLGRGSVGMTEDAESMVEGNNPSGMTISRSSSLTLPNPPGVLSQAQANKDERAAAAAAAMAALPPQPTTINGMATSNLAPGLGKGKIYEPKIYGFKVSERAKGGPRMKWLRNKPLDINELDESRLWHERYGGNVDGDPVEEGEEAGDENGDIVMANQTQPTRTKRRNGVGKMKQRRRTGDGGVSVPAEGDVG